MPTGAYGSAPSEQYTVAANYEFWGDLFDEYYGGPLQSDAYSANTALGPTHWDSFHTYRVEWRAGAGGFMRWSLDGAVQFQIEVGRAAHAMHMPCTCHAHAMHTPCICHAYAMHTSCTPCTRH